MGEIVSFAAGAIVGSAATYMTTLLTDRRRNREAEANAAKRFRAVAEKMPKLLAEMQKNIAKKPLRRRLFSCHSRPGHETDAEFYNVDVYFAEEHEDLPECLEILENQGYIENVTDQDDFIEIEYKMSEEFVELVKAYDFGERTD